MTIGKESIHSRFDLTLTFIVKKTHNEIVRKGYEYSSLTIIWIRYTTTNYGEFKTKTLSQIYLKQNLDKKIKRSKITLYPRSLRTKVIVEVYPMSKWMTPTAQIDTQFSNPYGSW